MSLDPSRCAACGQPFDDDRPVAIRGADHHANSGVCVRALQAALASVCAREEAQTARALDALECDTPERYLFEVWQAGYLYRAQHEPARYPIGWPVNPYETVAMALYPGDQLTREEWGRGWLKAEFDASLGLLSPGLVLTHGAWMVDHQEAVYRLKRERDVALDDAGSLRAEVALRKSSAEKKTDP